MAIFYSLLTMCLLAASMSTISYAEETASTDLVDQITLADETATSSDDEVVPRMLVAAAHPPPHHPPPHYPPPHHPPPHHPPPKAKPAPALPPSSGPFSFVTCPMTPTQYCDFVLENRPYKIPNFPLSQFKTDTILSANGPLWNSKLNKPVISASTFGQCYFVPEGHKTNDPHCGAQFYFGSSTGNFRRSNVLASRVFRPGVVQGYMGKCIVMPIATAKLEVAPAVGMVPAKTVFINNGDNNKDYPQSRRCVVFSTNN